MVRKFSHAKLPLSISHSCVTTMITAAAVATGCGANSRNGTTSCVPWLASTSTLCSDGGNRWKERLSGPGIGWVSWW